MGSCSGTCAVADGSISCACGRICTQGCEGGCQGCSGSCNGCTGSCDGCSGSCQGNCTGCTGSCQFSCGSTCINQNFLF